MAKESAPKETVLSGIRATGSLHVGNFLGAVRNFEKLQIPENRSMYFIADLHTLTTLKDPELLRGNLIKMAKDYIAAGLDPEQSIIYAQSSVPEISELTVLLGNFQPLGDLQRVPTFKDLVRKNPDNVTLGIISYPVLMAADILGPQATLVPVGKDQVPNVELARDMAIRFNDRFGEDVFTLPAMLEEMVKVPGLDGEKMGKSDAQNAIGIDWTEDMIFRAYKERGITDAQKLRKNDPGDPYNRCLSVYPMHEIVTDGETQTRIIAGECMRGERGCVACKRELAANIAKVLTPFQEKRAELATQDDAVREILHEGGKKAREIIKPTVEVVRDKMGVVVY